MLRLLLIRQSDPCARHHTWALVAACRHARDGLPAASGVAPRLDGFITIYERTGQPIACLGGQMLEKSFSGTDP
jgi:hypothetical protein